MRDIERLRRTILRVIHSGSAVRSPLQRCRSQRFSCDETRETRYAGQFPCRSCAEQRGGSTLFWMRKKENDRSRCSIAASTLDPNGWRENQDTLADCGLRPIFLRTRFAAARPVGYAGVRGENNHHRYFVRPRAAHQRPITISLASVLRTSLS